jgi:hypothetical protein
LKTIEFYTVYGRLVKAEKLIKANQKWKSMALGEALIDYRLGSTLPRKKDRLLPYQQPILPSRFTSFGDEIHNLTLRKRNRNVVRHN